MSAEALTPDDRERVVAALMLLRRPLSPKLQMPKGMIEVYAKPPQNPRRVHLRADDDLRLGGLQAPISPCQFGGNPDCANCGCIASAGLGAVGRHRLPGGLRVGAIFEHSLRIGRGVRRLAARRSA